MKYEIMKLFPGSWMEVGEQHSEDHISHLNPDSFPDVFKLVEYNFEGRIIKVGDKVGPMTITTIDAKNAAKECGYKFFTWNGWVYAVDGDQTGILVDDLF